MKTQPVLGAVLAASLSFCLPLTAYAQVAKGAKESVAIEEVIVTAQMREQRLLDVPMSIFAMSGEALKAANITDMQNLSYSVPGLSVERNNPFGPGIGIITIRGVGNSRGPSSLVGIYLDDSAVAGVPTSQIDLRVLDLERVEVLRGPQGTLYGAGSVGGTIRFITNDPVLDRYTGWADYSVSSTTKGGMNHTITAMGNVPIVTDTFGLRFSGTYENQSGWVDQPDANRTDINDNKLKNVRMKALWNLTESIDLTGTAVVHRNTGGGSTVVNLGPLEDSAIRYAVDPTNTDTGFHDNYDFFSLTA
ncbi:MAG: TonB-dependent receptor, partial [Woeseia sp.]